MNWKTPIPTKDEWLTPPNIIKELGPFDLDPCSPINRPWDTAKKHYTYLDNGLMMPWEGRVWCNPPYGKHAKYWVDKCKWHGNAILMIPARTETRMFHDHIWYDAHGIFFFKGRFHFYHANGQIAEGNSGAPICLVAYGKENEEIIRLSGLKGRHIKLI